MKIKLGQSALEIITQFPSIFPEVETFTFSKYSPTPGLEDRLKQNMCPSLESLLKDATITRSKNSDLSYWDSVLACAQDKKDIETLVNEAVRHEDTQCQNRFQLNRSLVNPKDLLPIIEAEKPNTMSICSLVYKKDDSAVYQIPFMDMHCKPSEANLEKCIAGFRTFGMPGLILNSGRSYHFYGLQTLTQAEWVRFMGKCLLLTSLTDVRYVGHRLMEGLCDIRVTEKSGTTPVVVSIIE
jgi:hypothetical protein